MSIVCTKKPSEFDLPLAVPEAQSSEERANKLDDTVYAYREALRKLLDIVDRYNELALCRGPEVTRNRMRLEKQIETLVYAISENKMRAPVYGCVNCGVHRRGFEAHFCSTDRVVYVDYVQPVDHVTHRDKYGAAQKYRCESAFVGQKPVADYTWQSPEIAHLEQLGPRIMWN